MSNGSSFNEGLGQGMGRRRSCTNLTGISVEVLRKTTDIFNNDIFFPGRGLNPRRTEQETGAFACSAATSGAMMM